MSEEEIKPSIFKKSHIAIGSGLTGLITFFMGYIDSRINASNKIIEEKYKSVKEYVDEKHSVVEDKLENIEKILIKIDDRIYEITKHSKGE